MPDGKIRRSRGGSSECLFGRNGNRKVRICRDLESRGERGGFDKREFGNTLRSGPTRAETTALFKKKGGQRTGDVGSRSMVAHGHGVQRLLGGKAENFTLGSEQ